MNAIVWTDGLRKNLRIHRKDWLGVDLLHGLLGLPVQFKVSNLY